MRNKGNLGRFASVSQGLNLLLNYLTNVEHTESEIRESIQKLNKLLIYPNYTGLEPDLTLSDIRSKVLEPKIINLLPYHMDIEATHPTLSIHLGRFQMSSMTQEVMDNFVIMDLLVPKTQWICDEGLRPFLILNELDFLIQGRTFMGLNQLIFVGADKVMATPELLGYTVLYATSDFSGV